jgi:1,4-alpha-glucan branching enzyme
MERPGRKSDSREQDGSTVLFIGRLVAEKQPLFFVDLAHRLHVSGARTNTRFTLIGEGPLGVAVRDRIAELGLTDVVSMPGYLTPQEVFARLQRADLLVIPSQCESFGKVAVEAMIAGTPVIASRVGGLIDIIVDGENGFLCEFGDIESFEKRILGILDSHEPAGGMGESIQRHREAWLDRKSSFGQLVEELNFSTTENGT